jgi:carbonic anhydrase/acetyltransferase-like protein (isoleucine patch superfamily)
MWLFYSKLHETFSGVTIDRKWCETHERNDINTHLHYQARASNIHTLKHKMTRYVAYVSERCFKHIPYIHVSHVALACFICFTSALHMFHAHIEQWCLGSSNASAKRGKITPGVLQYVQPKSCIYLASRLALSPNRLNRASTRASSPMSTIRCIQNDF